MRSHRVITWYPRGTGLRTLADIKPVDAHIPYVQWCSTVGPLYLRGEPPMWSTDCIVLCQASCT